MRRYCVANRLNRFGTLTYAGEGCHDEVLFRQHMGEFFRSLRSATGGQASPYLYVGEWHKTGHGLHGHFAVGRFIHRDVIEQAWGHGFIKIKLLGDLPVGSTPRDEARVAAGYLSKYVRKSIHETRRTGGLHRYECAQGFAPPVQQLYGLTAAGVLDQAAEIMGCRPAKRWDSGEAEDWQGPPAVWFQWR